MAKAAKESNTLLIVPNAGADAITGADVRAEHLPQQLQQLAAGLRHRRGRWRKKGYKTAVTITWNYAAGEEMAKGFKEAFEKGGGKVIEGADPAVPERRVPGAADRDRRAEARRGVRLLRRRRRGEVRQGLRRGRPEEEHAAVRLGLPDRRHARGAGRRGGGRADHAALRRRPEHPEEQRLPPGLRQDLQAAARRLCRAGLRRGADARRPAWPRSRATWARRPSSSPRCARRTIDSPRGTFTLSAAHNPVQDIYLREVEGRRTR